MDSARGAAGRREDQPEREARLLTLLLILILLLFFAQAGLRHYGLCVCAQADRCLACVLQMMNRLTPSPQRMVAGHHALHFL